MINYSDVIIQLHDLAREQGKTDPELGFKLRKIADDVARVGNEAHERSTATNKIQYQD